MVEIRVGICRRARSKESFPGPKLVGTGKEGKGVGVRDQFTFLDLIGPTRVTVSPKMELSETYHIGSSWKPRSWS